MPKLKRKLYEILFPNGYTCDICGIETFGSNLCTECAKTVTFNSGVTCPKCGRKTSTPQLCLECKAHAPVYDKAVSALVYEGGAVTLIAKFKKGGAYLKEYFADLVFEKLNALPSFDCIVFVPMTKSAKKKRGYNQTELLAVSLSKRLNIPVLKRAVIKTKDTANQKELSRKQREINLKGSFKVADKTSIKNKRILIVDDVITTGTTAEEISRVLLKAGATCVYLATVASVEYKSV